MEGEDERAAVMERGVCGVPLGPDSVCQRPKGRCSVHTAEWHQERELLCMQAEDDASCIADRGRCGVVPRGGGEECSYPNGRCRYHAPEKERCQSTLDSDPRERCWNYCAKDSHFCDKHADYPNYSATVQRWVVDRQQRGLSLDEDELMAHIRAEYPSASYQQPKIHDFGSFAGHFANLGAAAERARSPKRS